MRPKSSLVDIVPSLWNPKMQVVGRAVRRGNKRDPLWPLTQAHDHPERPLPILLGQPLTYRRRVPPRLVTNLSVSLHRHVSQHVLPTGPAVTVIGSICIGKFPPTNKTVTSTESRARRCLCHGRKIKMFVHIVQLVMQVVTMITTLIHITDLSCVTLWVVEGRPFIEMTRYLVRLVPIYVSIT